MYGQSDWGIKSATGIASSMKEMLSRNLSGGADDNHKTTLKAELIKLSSDYYYFNI